MTKRFALNDKIIAASKAKNAPRMAYALTDGANLYLEANHASATPYQWRMQFVSPVTGARSRLSFGAYPAVGIAAARAKAQEARELIAAGVCPARAKESARDALQAANEAHVAAQARAAKGLAPLNSFEDIAERMIEARRASLAASYVTEMENTFKKYAYPAFGHRFVGDITVDDIHALDEKLKAAGHMQMLKKLRRFCRHTFAHAIKPPLKLITVNPVFEDPDLFAATFKKGRPAMVKEQGIRELMTAITGWQIRNGGPQTIKNALRLAALTFQRPANIATAEKSEFDLDAGLWVIPGVKMKGRTAKKLAGAASDHVVYLARQSVELLRAQFAAYPESRFVFPSVIYGGGQCIGHDSMGEALNRLGFKGKHCAHGFRAMARTACEDELDLSPIVLERALSHSKAKGLDGELLNQDGGLSKAYARAESLKKRTAVMQTWADYLDRITTPKLALVA
jgi:integrase